MRRTIVGVGIGAAFLAVGLTFGLFSPTTAFPITTQTLRLSGAGRCAVA
ncbi:hypothetical protein [Armatimonas sp.]